MKVVLGVLIGWGVGLVHWFIHRLRLTTNGSSLVENESSIRSVNQQLPVGGVGSRPIVYKLRLTKKGSSHSSE